jgi:predicted transcriptional regulator of viral defense system
VKGTGPRHAAGLPPPLARRPYGVLRPTDAEGTYSQPRPEFRRLTDRGVLHRLAPGYYAVVPQHSHDRLWWPSLEATAYGIAAADYGPDNVVLMGISAARLHGAVPRALALAMVAVPKRRPQLALTDRKAIIQFALRDAHKLDAERTSTDLGTALVTTVEQTLLDLAHRPDKWATPGEARDAVVALWARADPEQLETLADAQRLKAALHRARTWATT